MNRTFIRTVILLGALSTLAWVAFQGSQHACAQAGVGPIWLDDEPNEPQDPNQPEDPNEPVNLPPERVLSLGSLLWLDDQPVDPNDPNDPPRPLPPERM